MSGVDFGGKKWSGGRLAAPNMTVICAIASNQDPPGTSIDLFRPWGLSVWTAALSGPHLDDDRARLICLLALSLSLSLSGWNYTLCLNVGLSLFVENLCALLRSRGFDFFCSLMATAIL